MLFGLRVALCWMLLLKGDDQQDPCGGIVLVDKTRSSLTRSRLRREVFCEGGRLSGSELLSATAKAHDLI